MTDTKVLHSFEFDLDDSIKMEIKCFRGYKLTYGFYDDLKHRDRIFLKGEWGYTNNHRSLRLNFHLFRLDDFKEEWLECTLKNGWDIDEKIEIDLY